MIKFRPHHFLCALAFQGKGYSANFIANFAKLTDRLEKQQTLAIKVISTSDDICQPCPYRRLQSCKKAAKIAKLDHAHAKILTIKAGDIVTWQEMKSRLSTHMTLDKFHNACQGCSWKSLGICELALKKLHRSTSPNIS